jgi:hypothetical protein
MQNVSALFNIEQPYNVRAALMDVGNTSDLIADEPLFPLHRFLVALVGNGVVSCQEVVTMLEATLVMLERDQAEAPREQARIWLEAKKHVEAMILGYRG